MRVIVIGATGTIGRAVVKALSPRHEVISVSRSRASNHVDLADKRSIDRIFRSIGRVGGVVCAAGSARFAPFSSLSDEDFQFSLSNKLMGQVNLVRVGLEYVEDSGAFVLTGGILSRRPMPGGAAISLVNAALEGFTRAAALEAPRGIRVNLVSPGWVTETMLALGMDASTGIPAAEVATTYAALLEGASNGAVVEAARG